MFKLNVVDGDISKQSKYISGLNKMILKPDYLKNVNKKCVKIFIFAVYYENEIKETLRQKYKIKQKKYFYINYFLDANKITNQKLQRERLCKIQVPRQTNLINFKNEFAQQILVSIKIK